jgi:hypothetical protein
MTRTTKPKPLTAMTMQIGCGRDDDASARWDDANGGGGGVAVAGGFPGHVAACTRCHLAVFVVVVVVVVVGADRAEDGAARAHRVV